MYARARLCVLTSNELETSVSQRAGPSRFELFPNAHRPETLLNTPLKYDAQGFMAAPSLRFRHVKQPEIYARRVDYPRLAAGFAAPRPDTRRARRSCEYLTNEVRSGRVPRVLQTISKQISTDLSLRFSSSLPRMKIANRSTRFEILTFVL